MATNGEMHSIPPLPAGLPEAPISRIPLSALLSPDPADHAQIIQACTTHGFFYLDLTSPLPTTTTIGRDSQLSKDVGRTLLRTSEALLALSKEAFALPPAVKESIAQRKTGSLFGFKAAGVVAATDPHRRRDVGEMFNVSRDDMLAPSSVSSPSSSSSFPPPETASSSAESTPSSAVRVADGDCVYPDSISQAQPLFAEFSRAAHGVGLRVLDVLGAWLGIEAGLLASRHSLTSQSGDHTRLTYGPGQAEAARDAGQWQAKNEHGGGGGGGQKSEADTQITTYAHTDFGSVTLLFNWLGGLQIESASSSSSSPPFWQYVRPLPSHAIVNLGDALVTFSGDRLKSGRHRVVQAPGAQAGLDRYSVVYFVRPGDGVVLEDLTGGSAEREGRRRRVEEEGGRCWTAREWIEMRARGLGNMIGGGGGKEGGE